MKESSLQKGAFVLSIDTELAWGSVHNGSYGHYESQYQKTREGIRRLLDLMERYDIRATWAVVGHLFLDECRPENGVKHPEIIRPDYPWFEGDWFDTDPCANRETNPFWYGADILEQIRDCRAPQEIGSHGFSHMIIGDPGCSRECFDSELKACRQQAARWGIDLKSFVFPRNSIGHLEVLASNGFTSFRGVTPAWHSRFPGSLRRIGHLVDSVLPVSPPVTRPKWNGQIWDIPASYFYPHRDRWARLIPVNISVRKTKSGLEKSIRERAIFHLWFHPFNIASDLDALLGGLEEIFKRVQQLKQAGQLINPSMGELVDSLQAAGQEVKV